jgi:hypothetical protein
LRSPKGTRQPYGLRKGTEAIKAQVSIELYVRDYASAELRERGDRLYCT